MTGLALVAGGSSLLIGRYRIYQMPTLSMANTLLPGDRIVGDASRAGRSDIVRGDIVVVDTSAWPVVGVPELASADVGEGGSEGAGGREGVGVSVGVGGTGGGASGWSADTRSPNTPPPGPLSPDPLPPEASAPDVSAVAVSRVVGLGGDTVSCCDPEGRLRVNGVPVHEEYLRPGIPASVPGFTAAVPDGHLFLLGDNRPDSVDSRTFLDRGTGTVPLSAVRARVVAVVHPLDRLGTLRLPVAFAADGRSRPVAGSGSLVRTAGAVTLGAALVVTVIALRLLARVVALLRSTRG